MGRLSKRGKYRTSVGLVPLLPLLIPFRLSLNCYFGTYQGKSFAYFRVIEWRDLSFPICPSLTFRMVNQTQSGRNKLATITR